MRWSLRKKPKTAAELGAPDPSQGADTAKDMTMYHCPRCGSGGVVGGSDGSISCSFCQFVFKVYAQPTHPSMPQTVNGQPYQPPGEAPISTDPLQAAPGAQPVVSPIPNAVTPPSTPQPGGAGGGLERFRVDGAPAPAPEVVPPALNAVSMVTFAGVALPFDAYVAHLAIRHADDHSGVIEQVRASRG